MKHSCETRLAHLHLLLANESTGLHPGPEARPRYVSKLNTCGTHPTAKAYNNARTLSSTAPWVDSPSPSIFERDPIHSHPPEPQLLVTSRYNQPPIFLQIKYTTIHWRAWVHHRDPHNVSVDIGGIPSGLVISLAMSTPKSYYAKRMTRRILHANCVCIAMSCGITPTSIRTTSGSIIPTLIPTQY
jgi:hypothetical protein